MEKVKKYNKFKYIFYILITIFICLYFAGVSGYYDKKITTKTMLTKEAIKLFEEDIKSGKAVDIKDYIKETNKDYQNKYSNLGYIFSNTISKIINEGVGSVVKLLKSLFS